MPLNHPNMAMVTRDPFTAVVTRALCAELTRDQMAVLRGHGIELRLLVDDACRDVINAESPPCFRAVA